MSAYTDAVLATTPYRYWPLDEASGTNCNELVANEDATLSGGVMGGIAGPSGIGGVAPVFTGVEHIELRASALLGGEAAFTIGIWARFKPSSTSESGVVRTLFGEQGSSGNDIIQMRLQTPASTRMSHAYGDDTSAVTQLAGEVFTYNRWTFYVFTRNGGTDEIYWNGGRRLLATNGRSGSTWTNAAIKAWLGMMPRASANPFQGHIAHAAVWKRVLTRAEILELYEIGTPLTRELVDRNWWHPTRAVWNQSLVDPENEPTIAANSATLVTRLAAQAAAYTVSATTGGGPFYVMPADAPRERVRLRDGTFSGSNPPDMYNAFGNVPLPEVLDLSTGGDLEAQVYVEETDELWEFWVMGKTLLAPPWMTGAASAGGSMTPNATAYAYVVYPALVDGSVGFPRSVAVTVSTTGQKATIAWGAVEGATYYRIYRRLNTPGSGGGNFMAVVAAPQVSWVDDGSITPGASSVGQPSAVTADWGCQYGGYMGGTDESIGVYVPPHQSWGASATSLPLWGGTVSLLEMMDAANGNVDAIPHALAAAIPQNARVFVFPAQRTDEAYFTGPNEVPHGTRFQLDPTLDVTALTSNATKRALYKALQKYGMIIRDHSGVFCPAYIEDPNGCGRDIYPAGLSGLQGYELFNGLPWSSMRVIDSAWTLAMSLPEAVPIGQLADAFDGGSLDSAKWDSGQTNRATVSSGKLRLARVSTDVAKVQSVAADGDGAPWSLLSSAIHARLEAVGGAAGDYAVFRVAGLSDLTNCRVSMVADAGATFKGQYTKPNGSVTTVFTVSYDADDHAWWRISESGGLVTFEASADGAVWASLGSFQWSDTGWPTTNLGSIVVIFLAGNSADAPARPDVVVDRLNLPDEVVVPPVALEELLDDFFAGAVDTGKWAVVGSPSQSGGELSIPTHGSPYSKLTSVDQYALTASSLFWGITGRPLGLAADQSGVTIACDRDPINAIISFWIDAGSSLKAQYVDATLSRVTVAEAEWDPVDHAWQRIREADGTVYFEVAPDGRTWTVFAQFDWVLTAWGADALYAVNVILFSGNYDSVLGRPPTTFSALNTGLPDVVEEPDDSHTFVTTGVLERFPGGTVLSVYRERGSLQRVLVTTGVVNPSTGRATFTGLEEGTFYVARATVGGVEKFLHFATPEPCHCDCEDHEHEVAA